MKQRLHYLGLWGVLLLGAGLRFSNLGDKPLWLDEILTALFSVGQSYDDLPLEQFFSLSQVQEWFAFRPTSCPEIAAVLREDSTHPPAFFCLMQGWLDWWRPSLDQLAWTLRSLSALMGVGAIAAVYALGRVAFSAAVGLASAALMAVSPFTVYLSQEARHYTLPMLLITLGLLGCLLMAQNILQRRPWRWGLCLGWIGVSVLQLYIHYFSLLALAAQTSVLVGLLAWQRSPWRHWRNLAIALTAIGLGYLPWLPTLLEHMGESETDWLTIHTATWSNQIAPLYQLLANWIVMVIILPVEEQPLWLTVLSGLLMVIFMGWLVRQVYRGWQKLGQDQTQRLSMLVIGGFVLCILLQFLTIVYLLHKDITVAPRYSFVYYPGVCVLLAAALMHGPAQKNSVFQPWGSAEGSRAIALLKFCPRALLLTLLVGIISSVCVVSNLAFYKPFLPEKVAHAVLQDPSQPLLLAINHTSVQDVAAGLGFVLAVQTHYQAKPTVPSPFFIFAARSPEGFLWPSLITQPQPLSPPLNLWIVGPRGMAQQQFPPDLVLTPTEADSPPPACTLEPDFYGNVGFPYQRYRCNELGS